MEPLKDFPGVYVRENSLYTLSANPGVRVYGERILSHGGNEYREWSPRRSKLSAYLTLDGDCFPFKKDSKVLYLGASGGTTASHVADICSEGSVICVEFSPRMFRDLVTVCEGRKNMIPLLGDATRPEDYMFVSEGADIVYQDVAQKGQAGIISDNMEKSNAKYGMVAIKSRSEDVTADPAEVFGRSEKYLKNKGYRILDNRSLEPFEKDHSMIVFGV
ncbi:MAG: fibrillarin-like rRNA/tRNA 2'-O-methyltransferase [Candidatus Methanomethylophilaceae archaeon]|jgi:fibrillarin-like pre-rRNA processing protein